MSDAPVPPPDFSGPGSVLEALERAAAEKQAALQRAIVLAWLGRPEVAQALARLNHQFNAGTAALAALRQLAEEGK